MAEAREETRRQRWRREVAGTTVGVLIALALGAVANDIGRRLEVRTARASLREELGEILGQARERERAEPCYRAKLERIARILDRAEADGRLPPIAAIGQPMTRTWSRGV